MRFVFLHVGHDPRAEMMVQSIKNIMPTSEVIQCTNDKSYLLPNIDHAFIKSGNIQNLMTYRLEVFANLLLNEPAVYLDTDILVRKIINAEELLSGGEIAICRRTFNKDSEFNANFRGMNLMCYKNMTLDQVYPYLASFNVTRSYKFWQDCHENLLELDKKFHYWYGDQEAIRNVINTKKYSCKYIEESDVSCLPEYLNVFPDPTAIHFKGIGRKEIMSEFFSRFYDEKAAK